MKPAPEELPLSTNGNPISLDTAQDTVPNQVRVCIVGSGFAGLGLAIRLRKAGIEDFVVLERDRDLGGTWYQNTYPGCQCDVPSHLYSFSFALNPHWSRTYPLQPEIEDYLHRCADRFGIRPRIHLDCEVQGARYEEESAHWKLDTTKGQLSCEVLVLAVGALSEPSYPAIPGRERFDGTSFHSATWDHGHDLSGERVAVIGTGASAVQVIPNIQPQVGRLSVFQRTPPWVLPHTDRPLTRFEQRLYRTLPQVQRAVRRGIYWGREALVLGFTKDQRLMRLPEQLAKWHLRRQVPDPSLREKLTPDYRIGCKRILLSNDYYPAFLEPNVELVSEEIREVTNRGIVTMDGMEREVDTIIYATGFKVTDMSVARVVSGRDGHLLADEWAPSPHAHRGTAVPGFPNMFVLVGPNTGLGHSSMVHIIESQIAYVLDALRIKAERGLSSLEVQRAAEQAYNEEIQRQMQGTVWTAGGCSSWYLDSTGKNSTLWPGFSYEFRNQLTRFDEESYELHRLPERSPAAP